MKVILAILVILPIFAWSNGFELPIGVQNMHVREKILTKIPFEDGPLSAEIKEIHPRLEFAGEINGKAFYYEERGYNWTRAKAKCEEFGAELSYFDSMEEADFLQPLLPFQYWWTAAVGTDNIKNFKWEVHSGAIPTHKFDYFENTKLALLFSSYGEGFFHKYLVQALTSDDFYFPLCVVKTQ